MFILFEKFTNNNEEVEITYNSIETLYLYLYGYNPEYTYRWTTIDNINLAILYIVTLLIALTSAYLSFSCKWGGTVNNIIIRLFFAFIAFMFGPLYLVYYFIFNYIGNMC
tara:strand:+ start:6880 stop:7209 length:330 start_codon:yes stop_codon:yes gene_type:complete